MKHNNPHHQAYGPPYSPALQRPIPPSTPNCVVFPYDPKAKRFVIRGYTPHQTQDRLSSEEVEKFLEQVNISLKKWHEENTFHYDPPCIFFLIMGISLFLLPLFFILMCCWLMPAQQKSQKDLEESIAIAKDVIQANNPHFEDRGLRWAAPYNFPHWIELETNFRFSLIQDRIAIQAIPVRPQAKNPEIQMVELAQQDYQAIGIPPNQENFYSSHNQFNNNMYNANIYNK